MGIIKTTGAFCTWPYVLGQLPESSEQTVENQRLPDTYHEDNWPRKAQGAEEQRD